MNNLKISSVFRRTTSFSPVDVAKIKRVFMQNNTFEQPKIQYMCVLVLLGFLWFSLYNQPLKV